MRTLRHPRRPSANATLSRLFLVLALVGICALPAHAQATPPVPASVPWPSAAQSPEAPTPEYAPGVVLVGLHPAAGGQGLAPSSSPTPSGGIWDALHAAGKPEAVFPLAQRAGHALSPKAAEALGRVYRYRVPEGLSVEDVVDILSLDPAVAYAEPDYLAAAALTPDDPAYVEQWALGAIGAPAAWDVTTGAESVAIAVVDSGIDLAHEDLAGQLWTNPGETPGNGVDDDGNGLVDDVHGWNLIANTGQVADGNGHGTQVAGVLGAAGNNARGTAGMCWGCRIVVAQAMQDSGAANYSDIAEAVAYAAGMGAGVINVSLGGYADSQTLRTAIQSAAATAVVVAGAGNDGLTTPFYPAAYPEAIAVASVAEGDVLAASSSRGPWVAVAAPGEGIRTTLAGGGYGEASGTSLATALVAGTAGLLRSAHPEWSPALVRQHLLLTAADVSAQNPDHAGMLGTGRLDAAAALTQAPLPQVAVTGWAVDGEAGARPAPGTAFTLSLTIANEWLPGRALVGTLSESDPYATVTDATGTFGDLNTGQIRDNAADTFGVTLAAGTPYSHPIPFTLHLTGSDGYVVDVPFTLSVRGSTETLPDGAMVETDTVWSGDKVYLLTGNASVAPGVTLTIEPGATIKVAPGKWFRIDGTLIAEGTEEAPIAFTTSSETGEKWAGLRFTDTAGGAVFDGEGQYLSGSILRQVHVMHAGQGVRSEGAPPYIDQVLAENCDTGIHLATGAPRITSSVLRYNQYGLAVPGEAQVLGNSIESNWAHGVYLLSGGNPVFAGNRIIGNGDVGLLIGGPADGPDAYAHVEGNLIAGNGIGLRQFAGQAAHNTIVNNVGNGMEITIPGVLNVEGNNLLGNGMYDVALLDWSTGITVTLGANFWGDIPASHIPSRIYDCNDTETGCGSGSSVGRVTRTGDLTEPDPDAPAFVRSVTVSPETVGIETGAVEVEFARPMLQEMPPTLSFHDSRRGTVQSQIAYDHYGVVLPDIDEQGRVWAPSGAGEGPGLCEYDGADWRCHSLEGSGLSVTAYAVHAAQDGCVWTGNQSGHLTRYCDGQWTDFTAGLNAGGYRPVNSVTEDSKGRIWVATMQGLACFDGATWRLYTADDRLNSNFVDHAVEDGKGGMWILTSNGGGLCALADGRCTAVPEILGMPITGGAALFRDSASRLWMAPKTLGDPPYPVLVYDDGKWHGYTHSDIGTQSSVTAFTEGPEGLLVASTLGGLLTFSDGNWRRSEAALAYEANWLGYDQTDNLWSAGDGGVDVLWHGLDYPVDTGAEWLSPTTYRATFDVTPAIPKGTYVLSVEGGVGTDGILAAPAPPVTFTVDYAGGVTDSTAPPRPSVRAYGDGSLSTIDVRWTASDPDSSIDEFRYALGTAPGGRDVVDWTYLPGSASSARLTGLLLARGQAYYATVAARNASGLWSANGISNGVLGGEVTPEQHIVSLPLVQR